MNQLTERTKIYHYCRSHVLSAVDACKVSTDPFPHFILHGFFPKDIYQRILSGLPPKANYSPFQYSSRSPEGEGSRWRFDLSNGAVATLDPSLQALWLGVRDALGCVELKRAVFRKLAVGLSFRYSIAAEEVIDLPGYPLPALFREETGYSIKPHPDTRKKMVTMQIALPVDSSQEALGTQFYRRSLNPLALAREPRGFDVVKTTPFVPNAAYAFVVLNTLRCKSWHGRTTLTSASGVRNTILNIWHEKPEQGHADVVREHYSQRRAA